VVGAGSFGTAVAVVLERAGLRTTLLARTADQAQLLAEARENERYLPGVELPRDLRVRALGVEPDPFGRSDLVFLAVPSQGIAEAVAELRRVGVMQRAGVVSPANRLVPPDGNPPVTLLEAEFGPERVACGEGPRTRS
jgi:glycerol-3-phosphate dehydrogenase (NAD(P)+)